jgi:UDP-N-acetylmuramoylalanine--D-glutamate ligase
VRGVEFYNDSKATNVDATKKALEAFAGGVHLILGGKDKDSDYGELAICCARGQSCLHNRFGGGEDRAALAGVVKMVSAGTLDVAVRKAAEDAVAARLCCWRRRVRASISLRTMSIGDGCLRSW